MEDFLAGDSRVVNYIPCAASSATVVTPCLLYTSLVDLALRLRDAAFKLRAHAAQRGVRRSDGCAVAAAEIVERCV